MSYEVIDQHRKRIDLEKAQETAREELKRALQEIRDTRLPELIGFPGGLDERLIIHAGDHRQAIRTLLDRLPDNIDDEDDDKLHEKAEDIISKIDSFEAARKAVKSFGTSASGLMKAQGEQDDSGNDDEDSNGNDDEAA